jgi:hypothetical protein
MLDRVPPLWSCKTSRRVAQRFHGGYGLASLRDFQ